MTVTVRDVERAIARRFPPERAEGWDRTGLIAGDPAREVAGIALALDPTRRSIAKAAELGANVLITHHPAILEGPRSVTPGYGPGGVLFAALDAGIALLNAHTNLDRDAEAQGLLPDALGLEQIGPLETAPSPMSVVTVYAPAEAVDAVRAAMTDAGAGRIGDYEDCSFAAAGTGSYTAPESGDPHIGRPGERTSTEEQRVEMVCPRAAAPHVIAAAAAAHPYEEPLVTSVEVLMARNRAALGMMCAAPRDLTLRGLATVAGATFNVTPRVWGDPDTLLPRVVTATGSASSLVASAATAGAAALVAGEVRYHDALEALDAGLCIIELGHDVTEWPLVTLLHKTVLTIPGLDSGSVHMLPATPDWWTV